MRVNETKQTRTLTHVYEDIGGYQIDGHVYIDDGKLVEESTVELSDATGRGEKPPGVIIPLETAKDFATELLRIVDEMTGLVQRTTMVKAHTVPEHEVGEHERKIPLGKKDMAGVGTDLAHCAASPPDEDSTIAGTPRKRRRNFTAEEILEIREAYKDDNLDMQDLATIYNVHRTVIGRIISKKSYKNVKKGKANGSK